MFTSLYVNGSKLLGSISSNKEINRILYIIDNKKTAPKDQIITEFSGFVLTLLLGHGSMEMGPFALIYPLCSICFHEVTAPMEMATISQCVSVGGFNKLANHK